MPAAVKKIQEKKITRKAGRRRPKVMLEQEGKASN
jgi:hypothetical protein